MTIRIKPKNTKLTTDEFIEKSKSVHGDRYDYSKSVYIGTNDDIHILCKDHGLFSQRSSSHLQGRGCPQCKNKKLTTDEFIEKSKSVHGDRYDYSKSVYISTRIKVNIFCNEHGIFEQKPSDHLQGRGCPCCSSTQKSSIGKFIEKSKSVHGDRYDYSKSVYVNNYSKISIRCLEHGDFEQIPNNHLNGAGCPCCSENGYRTNKSGYFYIQKLLKGGVFYAVKFGITNNPVDFRLKQQSRRSNLDHELLESMFFESGDIPLLIEKQVKLAMSENLRYVPKKEMKDGFTETLSPVHLDTIIDIIETFKKSLTQKS